MPRWRQCSPSARVGCGPRAKRALGHGGIGVVERATGISRATIQRELEADASCRRDEAAGPGAVVNRPPSSMRRCCGISMPWSNPPRRRSRLAAAVVLQKYPDAGGRPAGLGALGQPHGRRRVAAPVGLLPSRQRQDAGRSSASRSGCAVSVCRGHRDARPEARTPGHLRGYEEERSWWAISRMSAAFGGVRARPTASACTTASFAIPGTGRRFPTACTICAAMKAG